MAFTKLAAVGDALESLFVAALAAQSPPVSVYRGGGWLLTESADPDFVLVGHDGSTESAGPAGSEQQEPAGQGGYWRTARGDLTCAVLSQSGDTDMAARRARAEALLALLDAPLRADPTLSGVTQFGWMSSATSYEVQNSVGCVARYVFTWHWEVDL
jgi:hypothetical protein